MKIKLLILFSIVAMAACQPANDKNPALLGQWQGTEWLIFDKPSGMDASQVHFEFKDDGTYAASFGNQNQSGVWRTEKDKLYTTETGKKEIMVKFTLVEPLTKEKIQKMIGNGNTEEVLGLLDQTNKTVILLKSQFSNGKKQHESGLIESAEWQRTVARINYAILEMADTLGDTSNVPALHFEMNRGGQKETLKLVKK